MIEFNESTHEYKVDGVVVPSVTQIIAANGLSDFSMVPADKLEYAIALGNAVHYGSELHELGTLDESTVDESVKKRLDQWLLAKEKLVVGYDKSMIEKLLSSKLGFAGKPDRIYQVRNKALIVDLKTGAKSYAAELQTAGYEIMLRELFPFISNVVRVCIYLRDDSFSLEFHKDPLDVHVFKSCLNVYNFKKRMKLI